MTRRISGTPVGSLNVVDLSVYFSAFRALVLRSLGHDRVDAPDQSCDVSR